jgi:cellobiose-specific phosphotransferase system component IIB
MQTNRTSRETAATTMCERHGFARTRRIQIATVFAMGASAVLLTQTRVTGQNPAPGPTPAGQDTQHALPRQVYYRPQKAPETMQKNVPPPAAPADAPVASNDNGQAAPTTTTILKSGKQRAGRRNTGSPRDDSQTAGVEGEATLERVRELPATAERWALLVCVGRYDDNEIEPLAGPENDCRDVKRTLLERLGFLDDHIIVLSTDQGREQMPTRANTLREFERLNAVSPSLLFLLFSGHGTEHNGRAFFLPADSNITTFELLSKTSIEIKDLREEIVGTRAQQVLGLFDFCRSDFGTKGLSALTSIAQRDLDMRSVFLSRGAIRRHLKASAMLHATAPGQQSFDCLGNRRVRITAPGGDLSLLANEIEALKRSGANGCFVSAFVDASVADAGDSSGQVRLGPLVAFLQRNVEQKVGRGFQTPTAVIDGYAAETIIIPEREESLVSADPPSASTFLSRTAAIPWPAVESPYLNVLHLRRTENVGAKIYIRPDWLELVDEDDTLRPRELKGSAIKEMKLFAHPNDVDKIICTLFVDHGAPLSIQIGAESVEFRRLWRFFASRCPRLRTRTLHD